GSSRREGNPRVNDSLSHYCRAFGYEADDRWAKLPAGWSWRGAAAGGVGSRARPSAFDPRAHPPGGLRPRAPARAPRGEGRCVRPHGICIGPDDSVYLTDDADHTVRKFTPDGRLLLTLGTSGKPSDTGATSNDYRTVVRAGSPFHYPCNVALSPAGDIY